MVASRSYGPRPISIMLALILVVVVAGLAEAKPAGSIRVETLYSGRMNVETLDAKTMQPTIDDSPRVITTQDAYEAFVARIPKKEISKTSKTPPSKDPLLAKPAIDFTKQVMVVLIRGDSMYEPPKLRGIFAENKHTVVRYEKPAIADVLAQPQGMGSYTALVFAKPKRPVKVEQLVVASP